MKKNLLRFFVSVMVFSVAFFGVVSTARAENISGWAWGGYDPDGVPASGDETGLGAIIMDQSTPPIYGAIITSYPSGTGSVPSLIEQGYAWSSAYGWIDFIPGLHCTGSGPEAGKYIANCTAPDGSTPPQTGLEYNSNGLLTGWARIVSIAQAEFAGNSGGWSGWIKMSGLATDNSQYGVSIDSTTGEFCKAGLQETEGPPTTVDGVTYPDHCYAWSSELGWIDFAYAKTTSGAIPTINVTVSPATILLNQGQTFASLADPNRTVYLSWDLSADIPAGYTCTRVCLQGDCGTWDDGTTQLVPGEMTAGVHGEDVILSAWTTGHTQTFQIKCSNGNIAEDIMGQRLVEIGCQSRTCGSGTCNDGVFVASINASVCNYECTVATDCASTPKINWREVAPR